MKISKVIDHIVAWLQNYAKNAGMKGYVIGVSGGVDSALVSTLCAKTGLPLTVVLMPIYQNAEHVKRATDHANWLVSNFPNVTIEHSDLTEAFETFLKALPPRVLTSQLTLANTRSRLRADALYAIGGDEAKLLVAGTGNEVEDYGVGFFTKYGDGAVDLSPIGKLTKTEVWAVAAALGISQEIVSAVPSDGLWDDTRSDEAQIGASYPELQWAMQYYDRHGNKTDGLTERAKVVLAIYIKFHTANAHKMAMPPVCELPADIVERAEEPMPQ